MDKDIDQIQQELQEMVLADVRKIYSEKMIDHAMNPRNAGEMSDADGYGSALGSCGDSMEIWLRVKNDVVRDARFWTDGCSSTIACGSVITEMARGKPLAEVQSIGQQDVLTALDGLPADNEHCAALAANATKEAIKDYLKMKREPWKKAYRRR